MLKIPVDPAPPTPKQSASRALQMWMLGPIVILATIVLLWFL